MNLDNLTKAELITIIANMHDSIQHWNDGWGYSKEEGEKLNAIGNACAQKACETNSFSLDNIKTQ